MIVKSGWHGRGLPRAAVEFVLSFSFSTVHIYLRKNLDTRQEGNFCVILCVFGHLNSTTNYTSIWYLLYGRLWMWRSVQALHIQAERSAQGRSGVDYVSSWNGPGSGVDSVSSWTGAGSGVDSVSSWTGAGFWGRSGGADSWGRSGGADSRGALWRRYYRRSRHRRALARSRPWRALSSRHWRVLSWSRHWLALSWSRHWRVLSRSRHWRALGRRWCSGSAELGGTSGDEGKLCRTSGDEGELDGTSGDEGESSE